MRLRVVTAPRATCSGCTRRSVLHGFGIAAATSLLGACRLALDKNDGTDGGTANDSGGGSGVTTMCGSSLCVDLGAPANAGLVAVGGSLVVQAPSDRIIVVRTSDTGFAALSDICTHMQCGVRYDNGSTLLTCPCHGSQFSLSGAVLRGPALKPLAVYTTGYDMPTDTLTIML